MCLVLEGGNKPLCYDSKVQGGDSCASCRLLIKVRDCVAVMPSWNRRRELTIPHLDIHGTESFNTLTQVNENHDVSGLYQLALKKVGFYIL